MFEGGVEGYGGNGAGWVSVLVGNSSGKFFPCDLSEEGGVFGFGGIFAKSFKDKCQVSDGDTFLEQILQYSLQEAGGDEFTDDFSDK